MNLSIHTALIPHLMVQIPEPNVETCWALFSLIQYCNQEKNTRNTWGGRRRYTMTVEQEREFLHDWEAKATERGVLSVPPIHAALVEKIGRTIPISTTYRLLARHGWRKVQPDTKHPMSDPKIQEEFKKNSLSWWRPPV